MKRNIAIVAGGDSSEYEVSLRSAAGIYSFMDKERYNLTIVTIRGAEWKAQITPESSAQSPVSVDMDKNDFSFTFNGQKTTFDFAYITIHGTPGENGLLQGYFDILGIPYSCCGVLAAAITFNKYTCNHYLQNFGIRISPSYLLRKEQAMTDADVIAKVGLPCFIKSNVGGSSFGCTKVKTEADIQPAIEKAFSEGNEVIIEAFMQGIEITCGVYKTREKAVVFPITEVVSKNEFFDYEAKYKGASDEITPARIPNELRDAVQALTSHIYDILGCQGIVRIDYILTPSLPLTSPEGGEIAIETATLQNSAAGYNINLLEINTTPGMTATSFIPQQVRAAGLDIKDVLTDIIENKL